MESRLKQTIRRLINMSYETNTYLQRVIKECPTNKECIQELSNPDVLFQLNQVSNLYDILAEVIGQLQEQTSNDYIDDAEELDD